MTSRRIGLARALSKLGYCSRSQAVDLIRVGRVRLNAKVSRDPETPVRLEKDRVEVDGKKIQSARKIYLVMNKPRGIVTTTSDEKGRQTVYSILEKSRDPLPWVAPVGRLDKASEGLLLLTNDSEWGARIAAPETHLPKTYHVQVGKVVGNDLAVAMENGVNSDGEFLRATRCHLLRSGKSNCWLEITLEEGKNRQIRRMLNSFDLEVLRLVRTSIGPLQLGTLTKGAFRSLTVQERDNLNQAMDHFRLRRKNHGRKSDSQLDTGTNIQP